MPQLQLNQGPQDALLYDNTRSYFTNVGYVRTSNFQVEYRDVDSQNAAALGSTVQYVIPKAADLLGPVDLRVRINAPEITSALKTGGITVVKENGGSGTQNDERVFTQWCDELGFAMIEKITFSVGSNDIETLTGEQLQIRNELMTSDEQRLGFSHVLKSGRSAFRAPKDTAPLPDERPTPPKKHASLGKVQSAKRVQKDYTRLVAYCAAKDKLCNSTTVANADGDKIIPAAERTLTIPLSFFFTKHVSQYFPLAAVAGCNDVRISVKFRNLSELLQVHGSTTGGSVAFGNAMFANGQPISPSETKLRCHYVHVTGPEATTLMNKEHVRLLKLWQHQHKEFNGTPGSVKDFDLDLSFLHPVTTLVITIRRIEDMNSDTSGNDASQKGFFFYHGDGTNPNYDNGDAVAGNDINQKAISTVKVKSIQLNLNGQERHPGLSDGIEADYLKDRLLPMLHSNSNQYQEQQYAMQPNLHSAGAITAAAAFTGTTKSDLNTSGSSVSYTPAGSVAVTITKAAGTEYADRQGYGMQGSKNIFVYPFSLNPEGSNPSGAVNFSKVSHAKLKIKLDQSEETAGTSNVQDTANQSGGANFRVDVYALYYNWLQIKDGRALLSFA